MESIDCITESGDEQHPQGGGEGHDTLSTETEVGHRDSPSPKEFFFSQVKGGEDRVEEIIAAKLRDMGPRTPPPSPAAARTGSRSCSVETSVSVGLSESSGLLKIPEDCVVNSKALPPQEAATHSLFLTPARVDQLQGAHLRSSHALFLTHARVDNTPRRTSRSSRRKWSTSSTAPSTGRCRRPATSKRWTRCRWTTRGARCSSRARKRTRTLEPRGREPRASPCPLSVGVAAHMPLEPSLNPKGDIAYTNYVADQMEKGALAVCGVTKDFTYGANVPCTSVLVDVASATTSERRRRTESPPLFLRRPPLRDYPRVPESTREYPRVPESTREYPRVPESTSRSPLRCRPSSRSNDTS